MIVLYVFILALIQAITEFIPGSSFGHLCVAEHLLGMSQETGILLEAMFHLGTAGAIFFLFRKDLKRLGIELLGMFMDLIGNLNLYIHNRKTGGELKYARIIQGSYRKFAALLLVSMIPTALLGFVSRRLAAMSGDSLIIPGIGFLLSGILLLVTDMSKAGGEKGPREAAYYRAMWIGICQGLSVFPGISRMGFTICAALFCGYSRKFAVRFSVLMSFPAMIGAFFAEVGQFASAGMTVGMGFAYVLGALLAGVFGCLTIRFMVSLTQRTKLRYFAYYSFLAGIITLALNFV